MNYEFHVGNYVKTRAGYIGYIDNVSDLGDGNIVVRVRCEDEDLVPFRVNDLNVANNFLRIGVYDFTKKEKKKIEPIAKPHWNIPIQDILSKINELVDAVNLLLDKSTES